MRSLAASALYLSYGAAACAQGTDRESQQKTAAESSAPAGLGEVVVVTARRREENLQDVPLAITAIGGDQLARNSIVRLDDLTKVTPALQISPSSFSQNTPRFTIRSQSQFEPLLTLDPSVAVYFADVVQSRAHGLNGAMYDLSSVQVLKGPQGTLFGRNTTGGAVLIVPNAPTDRLEAAAAINVGNYDFAAVEGMLNVPLSETFAVRFAGRVARRDGYSVNRANGQRNDDQDNESWRASILYDSHAGFKNTLLVNGFSADENGAAFKLTGATANGLFVAAYPTVPTLLTAERTASFHSYVSEQSGLGSTVDTIGVSNTTEVKIGDITIKNIFGYRDVDSFAKFDYDGTTFRMFDSTEHLRADQISDEFQVLGDAFGASMDWIVGAYFFREQGVNRQDAYLDFPGIFSQDTVDKGEVENTSPSAFAQANYRIIEGLSLTAGGRYTKDKRELIGSGSNFGVCNRIDSNGDVLAPCEYRVEKTFNSTTYTLGIDYQLSPNHLIYLAHRRGYRSGGFNLRARTPEEFTPFSPEIVKDVEIGFKADWDIGTTRLRTNLALYRQDYDDIQRVQAAIIGGALVTTIVNAASATVDGFEVDATWLVGDNVELRGFYAYSDAGYDKWTAPLAGGGVADLSHNKFSYAPKRSAGSSLRFSYPLARGALSLQGDVYYQSEVQLQDANVVPDGVESGYTTANVRLEWEDVLGKPGVSAALWARNVTNTEYFTAGVPIEAFGSTVKTIGAPRTFGLELKYAFGN
jgi:iron complex outermembrane receptor protein